MKTARRSMIWLFLGLVIAGCQRDPIGPVLLESAEWATGWTVVRFPIQGRPGRSTQTCHFGDVNAFPIEADTISHCVSLLGYTEGGK